MPCTRMAITLRSIATGEGRVSPYPFYFENTNRKHAIWRGRHMETNWDQIDEESDRLFESRMNEARRANAAARDFFGAAQVARRSARESGILPVRNEHGEFRYTIRQGLKAACHTREDIAATLQVQLALLQRLDRNRNLLWVAIALLGYVAYRLS